MIYIIQSSSKGLYWYNKTGIKIINDMEQNNMAKLEGYKKVAVIENGMRYEQKDYFYALYDENVQVGDLVAVTGIAGNQVHAVKAILAVEETKDKMPKNITAEVIGRVDTNAFFRRVENRNKADQLRRQLLEKRNEIEARKDDEYYAEIDSGYAEMLKELRELNV